MRKKLIAMILSLTMSLGLAACSGNTAGGESAAGQSAAGQSAAGQSRQEISTLFTGVAEPPEFMPVADSFAGGDGTEASPYEIANGEQLARLAWYLSPERTFEERMAFENRHMDEAYYVLTADIELNDVSDFDNWLQSPPEYNWYPINDFRGHFDGQGHVIRGLYSCTSLRPVRDIPDYYQGLFAEINDNAVLKNITLEKALLINHKGSVASLAASAQDARVENCRSDAVLWLDGPGGAAGLLGGANKCYVADCTFTGTIGGENNQHNCYGIAGGFSGYMENCRNEADITTGGYYASGIIGGLSSNVVLDLGVRDVHGNPVVMGEETQAFLADKPDGLYNCVNTGNITVTRGDSIAGGIARDMMHIMTTGDVVVSDCRNEGNITCVSGAAGGICGNVLIDRTEKQENGDRVGSFTLRNCVNTGTVSGLAPASEEDKGLAPGTGGLVGTATLRYSGRLAFEDCRNEGNVDSIDIAGGFVGRVITIQGGTVSMTGCANDGDVEGAGTCTAGLLASYALETDEKHDVRLVMKECVNNGKITAQSTFVGGLCGHILAGGTYDRSILVENCANNGDLMIAPGALQVAGYGLATGAPVRNWKFDGFTNTGSCIFDLEEYKAEEYAELINKREAKAILVDIVGLTYDTTPLENCRQEGQTILRFSDKDVPLIKK